MSQPKSLIEQMEGKAAAELMRGSGCFPRQEHPVTLEPPCDGFHHQTVSKWDCVINGWTMAYKSGLFGWRIPTRVVHRKNAPLVLEQASFDATDLVCISVETFAEDESTLLKAGQLLRALPGLHRPASFELIGVGSEPERDIELGTKILNEHAAGNKSRPLSDSIIGWCDPYTTVQFVVDRCDAAMIMSQLQAHYPNSAITQTDDSFIRDPSFMYEISSDGYGATLCLTSGYCFELKTTSKLEPDPLGVAIAAMEGLNKRDWAMLQVLFTPARSDWAGVIKQAVSDPYKPGLYLFNDISDRTLDDKFSSPLFAVAIRIMSRHKNIFDQLLGWANQFTLPPQQLDCIGDDEADQFQNAILTRTSYRPGILLNANELAGLVHLPSANISSDRLRTIQTRTRPAPKTTAERGSVILGDNVHRGQTIQARISAKLRPRHAYVAGQTGTGKSTLLLNTIMQDIDAGEGVGVIDPHGDLIDDVLVRIPKSRVKDTILFNPGDRDFPPGFNILSYFDPDERERLSVETIATLQRFSPNPWGSRFEHIFRCALQTLLQFPNPILSDVPRLLIDAKWRQRVIAKTRHADLLSFWHNEFPKLPKGAIDPILNRLSTFLLNSQIRNVICQRDGQLNFDQILSKRKIFLANLSSGILTEDATGIFGTFLMSKFISATFRRARIPRDQRIPFYLYVDEFQNFAQTSIGFDKILSEARKYGLVLAGLANQFVGQLDRDTRAAIIGNIGAMICFRLGTKDAQLLADEFGVFSKDEILALERGEALARIGGITSAFNLTTYPPPPHADEDMSQIIIARARRFYARPRAKVEAMFQTQANTSSKSSTLKPAAAKPQPDLPPSPTDTPPEPREEDWDAWDDYVA